MPEADEDFGRRPGLTSQKGQGLLDCHHLDAKTNCALLSLERNPGAGGRHRQPRLKCSAGPR